MNIFSYYSKKSRKAKEKQMVKQETTVIYNDRQWCIFIQKKKRAGNLLFSIFLNYAFCSTATAQATVAPTIGLLPIPISPIISTCAGTEEEPANCASPCIRPIESVKP